MSNSSIVDSNKANPNTNNKQMINRNKLAAKHNTLCIDL